MKRVLVAMSGGVDSSVAAYLLKKEGYEVIGATIQTWSSNECRDERAKGCCSIRDISDARSVAGKLDIPYYVLDLSSDFKEKVIDYFVETYLDAKTPNPCIACNNHIKFGVFLKKAEELKADFVATGHYARRIWNEEERRWAIREAVDASKDQSYVLFGLNQQQIAKTLLPVGEYEKTEIRRIAESLGMRVFDKPDSQEICFVKTHYADFLKEQGAALPGRGPIVDLDGVAVGEHEGYHLYTIGQRKRIGVTSADPFFVVAIDKETNTITIGGEQDLYVTRMTIEKMNWMKTPDIGHAYEVKIRSRNTKRLGRLISYDQETALFEFDLPEKAVTPGQAGVLYDRGVIVGGGWIREACCVPTPAFS